MASEHRLQGDGDTVASVQKDIRVFLLDDHEVVRRGVRDVLYSTGGIEVVGEASSAAQALSVVRQCRPDVAVLDVRLGDGSGIEVCRRISDEMPDVACLILTSFADDRALLDAAEAGAAGFVLKKARCDEMVEAIRKIAGGSQLLDAASIRLGTRRHRAAIEGRVASLTPQERRIFDLVGEGYSNRQIADEMGLAEKTVKNYASNMLAKLGMSSRTQVAACAARIDERSRRWAV